MTGATAEFTITARTLVVTPDAGQSKVYGDADPTLTYTHGTLYNGDTDAVFSGALGRAAGENVGTYAIHLGTLSAGPNYAISFTTGVTFEITKATLSVNADPRPRPTATPTRRSTYTFSGFQNGEDATNPGSPVRRLLARPSGRTWWARPTRSPVPRATLDAANYTFVTGDTADFTITARTLVVTPDAGQSKVYGDADPTLTYTHGTLYNGDTDAVFSGALSRTAGENVGTYPIHLGSLSAGLELRDQLHDRQDLRDHQGHLVGQRRPGDQDLRRRRPGAHLHLQRVPVLRRRLELRHHRCCGLLADLR